MNALADIAWLAAPTAALLAACLLLVPLGAQVLARGVVFIDLAVAQVAACGVLAAGMLLHDAQPAHAMAAAALSALVGGGLVWWLARQWPQQREALIGLVYIAAASAAVVAVAFDPHGRERLTALLAADVLWAPWASVVWLSAGAAAMVTLLALRRELLQRDAAFYPLFALALSVVVQALGLYLVFALLIGPALWTRRGLPLARAIALAVVACLAGLALSWALDWPSGACVALALSVLGLGSAWGGRTHD
ncbi:MAG TPA: metal ABC transporter permease [Ramlibacter sp.]|nr:metal ABC transporter permease [Ramlibacter sp.]